MSYLVAYWACGTLIVRRIQAPNLLDLQTRVWAHQDRDAADILTHSTGLVLRPATVHPTKEG